MVDVGGGVDTSSLRIARAFSNVKCIIQDFPEVCGQAKSVFCSPSYIHNLDSDILIVARDERSTRSGGRRSSRFPASRLFLSSAYQRRLRFHPQAGSSSILSMNLKSYNVFFLIKKDPSRLERPILHQDPHRTAKSGAGGYETPRRR